MKAAARSPSNMEKMIWIFLLISLTSSVSEQFLLNVTSHGENSDVILTTPEAVKQTPGGPEEEEDTSYDWKNDKTTQEAVAGGLLLIAAVIALVAAAERCVATLIHRVKRNLTGQDQDRRSLAELIRKIKTKLHPQPQLLQV